MFEGNELQVALAHVGTQPSRPSQRTMRRIPEELDDLVLACLAKDRDQRPESAEQLMRRLDAVPLDDAWDRDAAAACMHTGSTSPAHVLRPGATGASALG